MRSLTVAIATYQRRERLVRQLRALLAQVAATDPGVQVLVIVDGSTDGSLEAALELGVDARWQPNRGLASARNAGLEAAAGEIIWFLDDDLLPSAGLLQRHRDEHEGPGCRLLLGPCRPPPGADADRDWLAWWDAHYAEPERTGEVTRFDRFTVANLSGPVDVFRSVGGFDESFTGYGYEDLEIGVRVLAAGVPVRFDPGAVAWHDNPAGAAVDIARKRSEGRNAVRLARRHPETAAVLFGRVPDAPMRLLQRLHTRSPRVLGGLSRVAAAVGVHGPPWIGRYRRGALHLASAASYTAGVADADPAFVPAALGRHPPPR